MNGRGPGLRLARGDPVRSLSLGEFAEGLVITNSCSAILDLDFLAVDGDVSCLGKSYIVLTSELLTIHLIHQLLKHNAFIVVALLTLCVDVAHGVDEVFGGANSYRLFEVAHHQALHIRERYPGTGKAASPA